MFKYDENNRLVLDGKYTKEELMEKRIELKSHLNGKYWNNYDFWRECIRLIDTHLAILEDLI